MCHCRVGPQGGEPQPGDGTLTQPPNMLPSHGIALVLSKSRCPDEEWFFFWLDLLERSLMSVLPPMGYFGIQGPLSQAMLKLEVLVDIHGPIATGSYVDDPGLSYH